MVHFCQDEALAIGSSIPVIGVLFKKLHKWYHNSTHHKCHHAGCDADHLHHHVEVEQLMPNPPARQVLTMEEVDSHFGQLATIFLMFDRKLLGIQDFLSSDQFVWFVNEEDVLSARWKNKFFEWDGKEWKMEEWCLPKPQPRTDVENKLICNVENIVEILHSIKRLSVEGGYLEAWFEEDEYGSSITSFIPDSFTRDLLELIENHLLGYHEQNTGSDSQGLDQEQEADSGSTQSDQETHSQIPEAGKAFRDEIKGN